MTCRPLRCGCTGSRLLVVLVSIAATFDQPSASPPRDGRHPFKNCNELNNGFTLLSSQATNLGGKALGDWSNDDVDYTRQQIVDCLDRGQLRQKEADRYRATFEALVPAILAARTQMSRQRQEEEGRLLDQQRAVASGHAAEHAEAMANLRQAAMQLQDYPAEGVADLHPALIALNRLKATADSARMKIDSTNVEDDRAAFAIQQSINDRIEAYRELRSARDSKQCADILKAAGLPHDWFHQNAQLAFSTGYQEPLVPLLCTWSRHGVSLTYSASVPPLTSASLTLRSQKSSDIVLSVAETKEGDVLQIVPTAYLGPEGSIEVLNQSDLQRIYALLTAVGN